MFVLRKKGNSKYDGARPVGVLDNRMRVLHLWWVVKKAQDLALYVGTPKIQTPDQLKET